MRAQVEQITEVISIVRNQSSGRDVTRLRIDAMHRIAKRTLNPKTHRPIEYATVKDKVIRKFSPDLTSVAQFDMLFERNLLCGDSELRGVLLRRAEAPDEEKAIWDALPLQRTA